MQIPISQAREAQPAAAAGQYRTLWRWHFYAGLFVMPWLMVLAVTGTLYVFQPQIEPWLYHDRMVVAASDAPRLGAQTLMERAAASLPAGARISSVEVDRDPKRSAEFIFRLPNGERESVYVNPYTGAVLGTLSVEHRFMKQVRELHRALLLGKPGALLMELAGCWTLVMLATGLALWWPRGSATWTNALRPRLRLRGRPLLRNLHGVAGLWLAAGGLAFVLTGLPWSGSWGKQFKALATQAGMGSPPGAWGEAPVRSQIPAKAMKMDDLPVAQIPWAVGNTTVPVSTLPASAAAPLRSTAHGDASSTESSEHADHADHADHAGHANAADAAGTAPATLHAQGALPIDRVMAIAANLGVRSGYSLVVPSRADGVYTVSYFPADPREERTLHIDQYSGKVLRDIDYDAYGAVAQAISYGTSLHMGKYFGAANQWLCALISMGLFAMAATGAAMWWMRRPARSLGAPARAAVKPPMRGWLAGMVVLGCVFPLMGASMLLVWLADRLAFGRRSHA
ncbi:PepSY domain-containing protein [Pandoraea nosoerga]|uniref:Peptidase n=1 Tax=Pandoraea nosoerga TaxID=2508296 RepID=A0A5E4SSN6_9BURK|nr:PepSY domain-containing protein [Pandoraea nosoerga]MBN4665186.1 PepSY domain-containing protein [Pandoraea nosoerga]MBN4674587.1 PepSY domain-containing protein [Pandoraea nosoerga]MBN4680475.1 PepSY domain-containing protein [Pandoraea nosoerga]MBN4743880.1 PepSY domain-containing protein [Pandoraea nosoerga]VVD77398.1 peptidase [Pandoraea nosoerga]